jgi:hypothetical protein
VACTAADGTGSFIRHRGPEPRRRGADRRRKIDFLKNPNITSMDIVDRDATDLRRDHPGRLGQRRVDRRNAPGKPGRLHQGGAFVDGSYTSTLPPRSSR